MQIDFSRKRVDTITNASLLIQFSLFLVFLVLKVLGYISWSWVFVTLPLWVGLAFCVTCVLLIGSSLMLYALFDKILPKG